MQNLLLQSDFFHVNELLKQGLILLFDSLSTFQSDVVLEIVIGFRSQSADLLLLLKIGADRLTIELALVHLQGEADLSALLCRKIGAKLVQVRVDLLSLWVEQVTV